MSYFNIHKTFLFPSFDLEEKEKDKIDKFLNFLEKSNVADIIKSYVKRRTKKGGRIPFNYYHLFAAILYGFAFKKYTLRDLDNACKFDLRFIYIMEQERPSYAVFCNFINEVIVPNEKEIFAKINERITKEVEIVLSESDAYIDGTKQEANANKYKFVWKPITFHKRITYKIESIINKLALIDNYKHIDLIRSSTVALAISKLEQIKETIEDKIYQDSSKALLAMLEKVLDYEEKERICGPNRNSYYKTDNEATAMALKADYYSGLGSAMHAAYNVQNLVIQGFSFAYYISQSRADINDFIDVIEHFHSMYNCYPKNICADAGYGSLTNYKYLSEKGIGNYVKHQSWEGNKSGNFPDSYDLNDDETITCLNGNIGREVILENRHVKRSGAVFYKVNGCNSCEWMKYCKRFMKNTDEDFKIFEVVKELEKEKQVAEKNLLSVKGIELRVNRSIYIEGDFGILKQDYKFDRFRRRGLKKTSVEFMLHALGLNIAKLFRFYEKGYLTKMWTPPKNTKPETFKKPNVKRLVKRGEKINKNVHKNDK